ncbi:MAG: hypothetical protein WBH00_12765 [Xanthobacteraceae bacterium]
MKVFLYQPLAKKLIVLLLGIWLLTIIGWSLGLQSSGIQIVASLFTSWLGDVLFFSIVGGILALISSAPAALEPFDERAKILLQGRSGSEVDFAKETLQQLGNYSETTNVLIRIEDFDGQWFKLVATSQLELKNLIADVRTFYRLPVIDTEQADNPADKVAQIISFSVDGQETFPESSSTIEHQFVAEIGGDDAKKISLTRQYWLKDGAFDTHSPARFTKVFSLAIANRSSQSVCLKLIGTENILTLEPNQQERVNLISNCRDIRPFNRAYKFYIASSADSLTQVS